MGIDPGYQHALISCQHVLLQNNGSVVAINLSWGKQVAVGANLDGNSLLTQGVDWSSRVHDALYVVSGNEGSGGIPVPTDEYNGVTVAFSKKVGGSYLQVDSGNFLGEDAHGPRRSIDLVAPGADVTMPALGGTFAAASGTSFAAPHVTGTVGLLQEHATAQINASGAYWDSDARRHAVMKAVIMNSVDKIADIGDGTRLCMEKDFIDTASANWLASDAYSDPAIPLDDQMGVGQLNAKRALKQFESGERNYGTASVPLIGWDYGDSINPLNARKYVLEKPLQTNSFFSVTLAWDREVGLNESSGGNGQYDMGESFTNIGLSNLDLYLMPKGATTKTQAITRSVSETDSVEHIFFQIPTEGEYEIWVYGEDVPGSGWDYGVAWWAVAAPGDCPADITGDDNVNVDDLLAVINNYGTGRCGHPSDIVRYGTINVDDLLAVINAWGPCFGACCLPNGSCVQRDEPECVATGGTYRGDHTLCGTLVCGGACCVLGGGCQVVVDPNACSALGGTYFAGQPCSMVTCPCWRRLVPCGCAMANTAAIYVPCGEAGTSAAVGALGQCWTLGETVYVQPPTVVSLSSHGSCQACCDALGPGSNPGGAGCPSSCDAHCGQTINVFLPSFTYLKAGPPPCQVTVPGTSITLTRQPGGCAFSASTIIAVTDPCPACPYAATGCDPCTAPTRVYVFASLSCRGGGQWQASVDVTPDCHHQGHFVACCSCAGHTGPASFLFGFPQGYSNRCAPTGAYPLVLDSGNGCGMAIPAIFVD